MLKTSSHKGDKTGSYVRFHKYLSHGSSFADVECENDKKDEFDDESGEVSNNVGCSGICDFLREEARLEEKYLDDSDDPNTWKM